MNNNITMLIRREIWEHRALWIVPLVITGVLILVAAFGGMHFNDHGNFWIGTNDNPAAADALRSLPADERDRLLAEMAPKEAMRKVIISGVFAGLITVQLVALGVVVFFYLLDCLLAERRDRSILFWKSLPVSDGEVVASKALTSLVVAPAFVIAVSAVMLLLFSGVIALRLWNAPFTPWSTEIWLHAVAIMVAFVPMVVLWYLPLAGYLLVISVWVRKNAFLWAVLPPAGIMLIEGVVTHTSWMARFLGERFAGFADLMKVGNPRNFEPSQFLEGAFTYIGRVFADWHIWVGAACGLALIYAAIRIRRLRDDS
jgi:ABC-2 type transport system permease protein